MKKIYLKVTAGCAALILIMGILTGCGNGSVVSSAAEIKAIMLLSSADTFREALASEAAKAAQEQGIQLDIVVGDGTSDSQVAAIQESVAQGYNMILCNPADTETALQLEIAAEDVPIVFFNSCPEEDMLKKGKYVYVGSNEQDAGDYQAEYVLNALADKEELNVIIIEGEKSHSATYGRTTAVKNTLKASGRTINYVFVDYADWSPEKAADMFDIFLKTGKDVDCVFCNNDDMALGVIQACKENGIDPSSLLITGVDATAGGCQAIEAGEMCFTVAQSAAGQGKACVEAVIALATGQDLTTVEYATEDGLYVYVPFEKVTAENVADYK